MTVGELIEKLEQVEDKEQNVIDCDYNLVRDVIQVDYGIMLV